MTSHASILGGLVTVSDIDRACTAYCQSLGLTLVEHTSVDEALAASWGCPGNAGSRMAVLRPESGADFAIRLVEQPDHQDFQPIRTYGWAAYELSVQDVFDLAEALQASEFEIVGPPKQITNMEPAFIPMQVLGPGREMIYCNQVLSDMPSFDLPTAQSPVDLAFIVILAAKSREETLRWYADSLAMDIADSFSIPYSMINKAFGLPQDYQTTLTMLSKGRMPVIEVDDYPAEAKSRPRHEAMLPPGNAMVTLAVSDIEHCHVEWLLPPQVRSGAFYANRITGTAHGPDGELLELVQI